MSDAPHQGDRKSSPLLSGETFNHEEELSGSNFTFTSQEIFSLISFLPQSTDVFTKVNWRDWSVLVD